MDYTKLKDLSVDDLMNLSIDDVAEVTDFEAAPEGLYSGLLVAFSIPDPIKEIEYFESIIIPTAIIQLLKEDDAEVLAAAQKFIDDKLEFKDRYYRKGGFGIQSLRTEFAEPIQKLGGGIFGQFFALFTQEGYTVPVNFMISHRASKPQKGVDDPKTFKSITYSEVKSVVCA